MFSYDRVCMYKTISRADRAIKCDMNIINK